MGRDDCRFISAHTGTARGAAEGEEERPRRRGWGWVWIQQSPTHGSQDTGLLGDTRNSGRAAFGAGQLGATVLTPFFRVLLPMSLEYVSYWFRGERNHFLEGHAMSEVSDSS